MAMAATERNHDIELHEAQPLDQEPHGATVDDDTRQSQSGRMRSSVLIGSAISQLPIWGFAMSYGVFQEYYFSNWSIQGNVSTTGVIGTTSNGVMYLSMPFLFGLFTRRWARWRQTAAVCGMVLACMSFLLSSFSIHAWHLLATQGVMAAFGCALIYSPTTLSLGEWFATSNRAIAYGVVLSCKNIVGSACPFLFRELLDHYGLRTTLRIWAATVAGASVLAILLIPTHPMNASPTAHRSRRIPWEFLKHGSFYVYSIAIMLQSSGYGIPQTYLSTYAREVTLLSQTSSTLLLTIFNAPGIISSSFFGYLSDNKRVKLSAASVTAISAICSALSTVLFWGLTSPGSMWLLVLFSLTFGFFAGGYSATWGAVLNELELHASRRNEAIDTGMVYGLLNGARGVGYVSGGLTSVPLLKAGSASILGHWGYGTRYGPLIVFTGLSSVLGGWALLWKWKGLNNLLCR